MRPAAPVAAEKVKKLIEALDSDDFETRKLAQYQGAGNAARP
jgi:hypothetical protein